MIARAIADNEIFACLDSQLERIETDSVGEYGMTAAQLRYAFITVIRSHVE